MSPHLKQGNFRGLIECIRFYFSDTYPLGMSQTISLKHGSKSNRTEVGMVGQDLYLGFLCVWLLDWNGFSVSVLLLNNPSLFCSLLHGVPSVFMDSFPWTCLAHAALWPFFLVSQKLSALGPAASWARTNPEQGLVLPDSAWDTHGAEVCSLPPVSSPDPWGGAFC